MNESGVDIQRADEGELNALQHLLTHYFDGEGIWQRDSPEATLYYLRLPQLGFYIAQAGAVLAGCILVRSLPSSAVVPEIEHAAECKRLYVLPAYRGRGIAARLIATAEQGAREAGFTSMYLDSKAEFQTALALYTRLGYEPCERFNDNAQATIFMRKQLR